MTQTNIFSTFKSSLERIKSKSYKKNRKLFKWIIMDLNLHHLNRSRLSPGKLCRKLKNQILCQSKVTLQQSSIIQALITILENVRKVILMTQRRQSSYSQSKDQPNFLKRLELEWRQVQRHKWFRIVRSIITLRTQIRSKSSWI